MKWGITLLLWTATGLFLANSCLDYVRVWQNPPPGYTRAEVQPRITACGVRKTKTFAVATVGIVALYYGSGWVSTRLRNASSESHPDSDT